MASSTERIRVKLPQNFDPARHMAPLMKKITDAHGEGFEVDSIEDGVAVATRQVAITEVSHNDKSKTKEVRLPRSVKPTDGEKMAVKLADQHGDGWEMTKFEPFLGKAVLTQLSPETARCRGAAALALGVKPWEVQVKPRRDGGFDLELPRTYMPSKHFSKLEEVATGVVGRDGWYVKVNAQKLTASIVPSAPPTFSGMIPTPMSKVVKFDHTDKETYKIPLGMKLPPAGESVGETFYLDMNAGAHAQLGGISGGGKAQPLDSRLPVPVSERFPQGWALNRDLHVGDKLYGADGSLVSITGFSEVTTEPVYEVEFSDGQVVRTSANHLWKASTAASRGVWNSRLTARRAAHYEEFQERAKDLRKLASTLPVGTVGSLLDVSRLAGLHENSLTAMHLPIGHLATEAVMPTTRKTRLFDVAALVDSLRRQPAVYRGQPLTAELIEGKGIAGSLTMRAIASGVLGVPATRADRAGMSKILRLRKIPHSIGTASQLKKVYPVDEVLAMIAERLEAQSLTSDSGRSVMDLETVVTTRDMAENLVCRSDARETVNYAIRLAEPIEGTDEALPVDPYVLGAWLGDGSRWHSNAITSADYEIVSEIEKAGYPVLRSEERKGSAARTYFFGGLNDDLDALGMKGRPGRREPAVKQIPATYLRASRATRLALLQGLMDTDGTIAIDGGCSIDLCDERLAKGTLELIRSLGIRASWREAPATITEPDPKNPGKTTRRVTGTRYRMAFTTDLPVFRMTRKSVRVPASLRATQRWNYVQDVRVVESAEVRCIAVDHPEHLYLTNGFIPTHNTVLLNCYLATWLAKGAELAIIDLPTKSADFEWCKDFVRPGGWGCASPAQSAVAIRLIMEEGERRSKLIKSHGVNDWKLLPKSAALKPLIVIVDELTGLFALEAVPKAGKDAPQLLKDMADEANRTNLFKEILKNGIKRVAAELRFTGVFLMLATQVASANTGIEPALRTNLHHKLLMGAKPTEGNRRLVFSDPDRVPLVPDNIRSDGAASRGVGSSEPEGDEPAVFKSYFATVTEYRAWLEKLGVPKTSQPEPTKAQMAQLEDAFEPAEDQDAVATRRAAMKDPMAELMGDSGFDENGRPLKGAALAASQSRALSNMAARA